MACNPFNIKALSEPMLFIANQTLAYKFLLSFNQITTDNQFENVIFKWWPFGLIPNVLRQKDKLLTVMK